MNMTDFLNFRPLMMSIIGSLVLVGCGGDEEGPVLHAVSGTVSLDGEPVQDGRIQFRTKTPEAKAYSAAITNGEYEVQTEAGSMSVEITASRIVPGKFGESASPDEPAPPLSEMYIPEQFNSKTTLTADIEAGADNTVPFDLTSK